MRYLAKFAGTGLILIGATACAGTDMVSSQPAAGPPGGSVSTQPAPGQGRPGQPGASSRFTFPAGSLAVPGSKVDYSALPKDFPHEVSTTDGGKVLEIRAEEGGCGHALGTAVRQNAQQVVVDLSETKAQTGQMCTMDLRFPVISVALAAPLDARTVVLTHSAPK